MHRPSASAFNNRPKEDEVDNGHATTATTTATTTRGKNIRNKTMMCIEIKQALMFVVFLFVLSFVSLISHRRLLVEVDLMEMSHTQDVSKDGRHIPAVFVSSGTEKRNTIQMETKPLQWDKEKKFTQNNEQKKNQNSNSEKRKVVKNIPQKKIGLSNVAANLTKDMIRVEKVDSIYSDEDWDISPIVLEKHKLIFFTVPKVACTVWKTLFRRMMGYEDFQYEKRFLLHDPKRNGLNYLRDYTKNQATYLMNSPEYTRAIFLRDPKERLLSAYTEKVLRFQTNKFVFSKCCTDKKKKKKGKKSSSSSVSLPPACNNVTYMKNQSSYMSFEEFVTIAKECDNGHWRPQSKRMEPKFFMKLNFIGHLDTVEQDAKALLQRVGAWEEYGATGWGKYNNESLFQSTSAVIHATHANEQVENYYNSAKLIHEVEAHYAEDYDFELFQFKK